jgi:hypothetical protein
VFYFLKAFESEVGFDPGIPVFERGGAPFGALKIPFHVTSPSAERTSLPLNELTASAASQVFRIYDTLEELPGHLSGVIAAITALPIRSSDKRAPIR